MAVAEAEVEAARMEQAAKEVAEVLAAGRRFQEQTAGCKVGEMAVVVRETAQRVAVGMEVAATVKAAEPAGSPVVALVVVQMVMAEVVERAQAMVVAVVAATVLAAVVTVVAVTLEVVDPVAVTSEWVARGADTVVVVEHQVKQTEVVVAA